MEKGRLQKNYVQVRTNGVIILCFRTTCNVIRDPNKY